MIFVLQNSNEVKPQSLDHHSNMYSYIKDVHGVPFAHLLDLPTHSKQSLKVILSEPKVTLHASH